MLSRISVKKPVTVIMITLIFIIYGVVSLTNLSTALMPSIDIPIGVVIVSYPGASPEEMETMVTTTIEGTLETVENVKGITSTSSEHMAAVIIEFVDGIDIDMAMLEVREKLDLVKGVLPEGVGDPMTMTFNPDMMPVMAFSVTQDGKEMAEVTDFVNRTLKPRIERQEGVAQVTVNGGTDQEIEVILDSEKIELLGLNRDAISGILMAQNFNFPAGTIEEGDKSYTLRAVSEFTDIADMEDTVIMNVPVIMLPDGSQMDKFDVFKLQMDLMSQMSGDSAASIPMDGAMPTDGTIATDGAMPTDGDMSAEMDPMMMAIMAVFADLENAEMEAITLGDFATIEFVDKNEEAYTKVNGQNAITLSIQKQTDINTNDVSDNIIAELEKIKEEYPGTEIVMILDQAEYIDLMVGNVSMNGLMGGLLAILILFIFLKDIRPTVVIGVAIPISIIVAFSAIYFAGITLNIVSMGGLALGIGMLVDNAVVVLENIYRLRREGMKRVEAAVEGARQVSGAIVASTLTTVAVFMPVVFVDGFTAGMFKELALTVSITLLASLLVALTLVPMLSSKLIKKPDASKHHKAMDATRNGYTKILTLALKHKIVVILIAIIVSVSSVALLGTVGSELMPMTDEGQISVTVTMPKGSLFKDTVVEVKKVEDYLLTVEDIEVVSTQVGGGNAMMSMFMGGGNDSGSITVLLVDAGDRDKETSEIADDIRGEVVLLTEAEVSVEASSSSMMAFGSTPVSYNIMGDDFEVLEQLAAEVTTLIESVEGTVEVDNGIVKGSPELSIFLDETKALPQGITTAGVAMEISDLLSGVQSTSLNIDGRLVPVYVNESANTEITLDTIENISFDSPYGTQVALKDVGTIEEGLGYTSITRNNQMRTLNITGKLEEGYDVGTVTAKVNALIEAMDIPEGYIIEESGEAEQIADSFKTLGLALILGAVLVYMIMASQFESLIYPVVIGVSVLFAFSGAFLALVITGTPLSIVSMLGLIVLTGIVVNNGIVLVDYINQLKAEGKTTPEAILIAGPTRLRPILMTALTTILALLPITLGFGEGSEMMTPLGLTVVGGLTFSTILTLVLVPVMYGAVDSTKDWLKKVLNRKKVA